MSLLRLIVWGLIFYIVTKVFRSVSKIMKTDSNRDPLQQPKQKTVSKLNIDTKDIIDAEFKEVKSQNESK